MTTEMTHRSPFTGVRVLLGSASTAVVAGLVVIAAAAVAGGADAVAGAVAGALLTAGVLAFGAFVVNAVAGVMPAAALVVALFTYTLQVLVMGLVFWVLSSSPQAASSLDERWLGGSVIVTTLAWLVAQLTLTLRQRIPVYDLAPAPPAPALTGGER